MSAIRRENAVQLLLEDKKNVFQEKLALIKINKSVYTLILPFLAVLLSISKDAPKFYVMIPFVINAVAAFLYFNTHTLNNIYEYLCRLDYYLNLITKSKLPYYQVTVGPMMETSEGYK